MSKSEDYEADLIELQALLVRWQQWAIEAGERVVVVFEGRDAAGKDGAIKRITEHLPPRNTRVVALPKPSDVERTQWYFQRYVPHLPSAGQLILFNRSWYNRAGVEPVMGFCTPAQHAQFLREAPQFEDMLVDDGIKLIKLWLDISKEKQAERLEERRRDPLKILKVSPLDAVAQAKWEAYSAARDEMLSATHRDEAPWTIVCANRKKPARLAVIRHILRTIAPKDIAAKVARPDEEVLFRFEPAALKDGRLSS